MSMTRRRFLHTIGVSAAGLGAVPLTGCTSRDTPAPVTKFTAHVKPLDRSVFEARMQRAGSLMREQGFDAVFVEPDSTFYYLTRGQFGRSERLIGLLLSADGRPVVVCPAFEEERIRKGCVVEDVRVWQEHESPYTLAASVLSEWGGASGRIGAGWTVRYQMYHRLSQAVPKAEFIDAAPVLDRMRMVKTPDEIAYMRVAIQVTEKAIVETHAQLREGQPEQEVSRLLSREMDRYGTGGGGLIQFGPNAALPHGGPGDRKLQKGDVVLIDVGSSVEGYTSDITRTTVFGAPTDEVRKVFDIVRAAQAAGIEAVKPGVRADTLDQTARTIIKNAGYGPYFTHRLGHGIGLDGHEPPYLVSGNSLLLEPGMTFTVEPGIYLPGKFGVRIEDMVRVTDTGVEVLTTPVSGLTPVEVST